MRAFVAALVLVICNFGHGSATTNNAGGGSVESRKNDIEWTAEDMPDPRYCPECCGITDQGWICDPDGIFTDRALGGGPNAADLLNTDLWTAANHSFCPCSPEDCDLHNVIILVAVVKKLKNPDKKPKNELIGTFAKELQEEWWKADDSGCQKEIIIALSIDDQVITTEIGDDVLQSEMMTYNDVALVGGVSQSFHASYDLFSTIKFLINAYGLYIDHPPPGMIVSDDTETASPSPSTSKIATQKLKKSATERTTTASTTSAGSFTSVIATVLITCLLITLLALP